MKSVSKILVIGLTGALLATAIRAQDIETALPVVAKTVPEAGTKDVTPGIVDIRITFSKPMADNGWVSRPLWENSIPDCIGVPKLEADHRTYVLKVKLQPNTTYGYLIAPETREGFRDEKGRNVMPFAWVFRTKGL